MNWSKSSTYLDSIFFDFISELKTCTDLQKKVKEEHHDAQLGEPGGPDIAPKALFCVCFLICMFCVCFLMKV